MAENQEIVRLRNKNRITIVYKVVDGCSLSLDLYPASIPSDGGPTTGVPTIVYFHGGGLNVGNRESWFPTWFYNRLNAAGITFISADYRLMPPASGHEIVEDVKDIFAFIHDNAFHEKVYSAWMALQSQLGALSEHTLPPSYKIDKASIGVAGSSAGGLCAYLAAIHVTPKPKVLISVCGQGGHFLSPQYLTPKTQIFFRGRDLLDPSRFSQYLYPEVFDNPDPRWVADSPPAWHPPTSPTPGYPANPRMQLVLLYLQLAVWLDYYTGEHNPGLSQRLNAVLVEKGVDVNWKDVGDEEHTQLVDELSKLIPERHRPLFPQLHIASTPSNALQSHWPPTALIHGTSDTAVLSVESELMYKLLKERGVWVDLVLVDGQDHAFDYAGNAEERFGKDFDKVVEFAVRWIRA
ncbi:alpha/beta-hydrolase [Pluteus cervinus]|uniref:Alpha/beta-hydrolase n=1 Tax=Pluteus cervinus TaxID=181527 RepID=A0ACD3AZW1_9AGAR|nr:alpha/beta-hydrolase [Pluteus cervinus]